MSKLFSKQLQKKAILKAQCDLFLPMTNLGALEACLYSRGSLVQKIPLAIFIWVRIMSPLEEPSRLSRLVKTVPTSHASDRAVRAWVEVVGSVTEIWRISDRSYSKCEKTKILLAPPCVKSGKLLCCAEDAITLLGKVTWPCSIYEDIIALVQRNRPVVHPSTVGISNRVTLCHERGEENWNLLLEKFENW